MTDHYGQGRWGTGDRPLGTGPAQSAWDQGAQQRRFEEQRRHQEMLDRQYKQQREDQQRRQEETRRMNEQHRPVGAAAPSDDTGLDETDFEGILFLGVIIGFTCLLISIWNALVGQFHPTQPILAFIVKHGVWAVGATGVIGSYLLHDILMKIAKIILLLAVLFFGSAIVYGLYQGITGTG